MRRHSAERQGDFDLRKPDGARTRTAITWLPHRGMLWCAAEDLSFIVCLNTGRYHTLEGTAAIIWQHLCHGTVVAEIAESLVDQFAPEVTLTQALEDVDGFLEALSARRLLVRCDAQPTAYSPSEKYDRGPRRGGRRSISSLGCLIRLVIVHVLLVTTSLWRALKIIDLLTRGRAEQRALITADTLAARVARAAAFYPLSAACLEQSVCLLWAARSMGYEVTLRLGIRPLPFSAHAWVEYQGAPLNDSCAQVAQYIAFPPIELEQL